MIKERFSNFEYNLPEDPEKLLYDFYFLITYGQDIKTRDEKANFAIQESVEKIVKELKKHMLSALKYALSCEFKHVLDSNFNSSKFFDQKSHTISHEFYRKYEKFYKRVHYIEPIKQKEYENYLSVDDRRVLNLNKDHEMDVYSYISIKKTQEYFDISDLELSDIFEDFFKKNKNLWNNTLYGGKKWGLISDVWGKILSTQDTKTLIIYIDRAYDLQHNTDTIFNKLRKYYKNGFEWIRNALDWKFEVSDIRDFYYKVSKQLKPIVAYVSKNIQNKAIHAPDVMIYKRWEDGTWEDGVWKNGTWENGVWKNGTWEDGVWKNGTWENGVWKNGRREDGTWENGVWKNGRWEHGRWEDGTWMDGVWKNGTWENGTWYDGTWEIGTWENGIWKNGTWEIGIWENGTWYNGVWYNATWIDGVWKNGVWKDGIWEHGRWEDGTWEDGVWKNGVWKNGVWKNGIWKNGTWERGTWYDGTWKNGRWEYGRWDDGTWMDGTWKEGTWYNGRWEKGVWKRGVWRKGVWKNGTWEDGTWIDGVWKNGVWKNGDIYSNKFKVYIKSKINPKEFSKLEKKSESLEELKKLLLITKEYIEKVSLKPKFSWKDASYGKWNQDQKEKLWNMFWDSYKYLKDKFETKEEFDNYVGNPNVNISKKESIDKIYREKYFDTIRTHGNVYDIFKNPTSKEITELVNDVFYKTCRAILTIEGDLYIFPLDVLHQEFIATYLPKEYLKDYIELEENPLKNGLKYVLPLVYYKSRGYFNSIEYIPSKRDEEMYKFIKKYDGYHKIYTVPEGYSLTPITNDIIDIIKENGFDNVNFPEVIQNLKNIGVDSMHIDYIFGMVSEKIDVPVSKLFQYLENLSCRKAILNTNKQYRTYK